MTIKPIETPEDYQKALNRLEIIFHAQKNSPEGDELEILSILIDKYENENFLYISRKTGNCCIVTNRKFSHIGGKSPRSAKRNYWLCDPSRLRVFVAKKQGESYK